MRACAHGAGNGDRTRSLLLGKQMLCHLSYTGEFPEAVSSTTAPGSRFRDARG